MADGVFLTLEDFDGDAKTTTFSVKDVADEPDFATWDAKMVTLRTQLLGWTAGRARTQGYRIVTNSQLPGAAATPIAQHSVQAIFEMQDSVTSAIYTERLGCADLAKVLEGGQNAWVVSGGLTIANPLHPDYITLKAAIEAVWESVNGNTGTLVRVYIEE